MSKKHSTNNLRLLEFITKWDSKEWKKVLALIESGYVRNVRDSSLDYLKLLIKYHSRLKQQSKLNHHSFAAITKKKVSGDRENDLKIWSFFTSEILKVCNYHIRFSLMNNDAQILADIGVQHYYLNHAMSTNHSHSSIKNEAAIEKYSPEKSMEGFIIAYYEEAMHFNVQKKDKRQELRDFKRWIEGNELFYHENKLRIINAIIERSSFENINDYNWLEEDYPESIPSLIKAKPQIQLYEEALLMHKEKSIARFDSLRKSLDHILLNEKSLPAIYLEPLYYKLLNFCIEKILSGNDSFLKTYLDINLFLLEKGLLLEQGYMSGPCFKNIFNTYIRLKELDDADQFMLDYSKLLFDYPENPFRVYCSALFDYSNADFKSCLVSLNSIDTKKDFDDFLKVDIKILLVLANMKEEEQLVLSNMKKEKHFEIVREIRNLTSMLKRKDKVSDKYINIWKITASYLKKIHAVPKHEINYRYHEIIAELKKNRTVKNSYLLEDLMKERLDS